METLASNNVEMKMDFSKLEVKKDLAKGKRQHQTYGKPSIKIKQEIPSMSPPEVKLQQQQQPESPPPPELHDPVDPVDPVSSDHQWTLDPPQQEPEQVEQPKLRNFRKIRKFADTVKTIPNTEFKKQLANTSDILRPLQLGPKTKKGMRIMNNYSVGRLLAQPARAIENERLAQVYFSRLTFRALMLPGPGDLNSLPIHHVHQNALVQLLDNSFESLVKGMHNKTKKKNMGSPLRRINKKKQENLVRPLRMDIQGDSSVPAASDPEIENEHDTLGKSDWDNKDKDNLSNNELYSGGDDVPEHPSLSSPHHSPGLPQGDPYIYLMMAKASGGLFDPGKVDSTQSQIQRCSNEYQGQNEYKAAVDHCSESKHQAPSPRKVEHPSNSQESELETEEEICSNDNTGAIETEVSSSDISCLQEIVVSNPEQEGYLIFGENGEAYYTVRIEHDPENADCPVWRVEEELEEVSNSQ